MSQLIFLESTVKLPLMNLPVRSTYVSLQSGQLLIAPGSQLSLEQLKKLGSVTDLIAPNLFHCAGIQKATSVFANAKRWVAQGASGLKPEIPWTDLLSTEKWPFQDELPMLLLQGMPKANEVVFFHKKSKSLIVTDLCFNLLEASGFGAWAILNLFGTYRKFAISKFFLKFVKDRVAFENSLREMYKFDFENIIISHGLNVIGNAKQKLREALAQRNLKI